MENMDRFTPSHNAIINSMENLRFGKELGYFMHGMYIFLTLEFTLL